MTYSDVLLKKDSNGIKYRVPATADVLIALARWQARRLSNNPFDLRG